MKTDEHGSSLQLSLALKCKYPGYVT